VEEAPFSPIGQNAREECAALMAEADAVVIAEAPIGSGNLANLDLAAEAQAKGVAVVLYGATEPEERDFTLGEGARIWRAMESRGAPRARDFAELDALLERITVERREPSG
jgi:iron complex transport system ATP-binding protein